MRSLHSISRQCSESFPSVPGCQDRNHLLLLDVVVAIFVRVWSAVQSGFVYRLIVPRRLLRATTTTVISTVLLKGVKCPVITHVPLTSSRAELNILPGSYSWYHSTFFTQPHQKLLAVLMQLCAPFRGADGPTYDSSTRY